VRCGKRKTRTIGELQVEKTQLEMQLVVARLATAGAVANEASSRATFESIAKSAEDRATTVEGRVVAAEAAATKAASEKESLEASLAQAKAKVAELQPL
jgi:hypothetical protein